MTRVNAESAAEIPDALEGQSAAVDDMVRAGDEGGRVRAKVEHKIHYLDRLGGAAGERLHRGHAGTGQHGTGRNADRAHSVGRAGLCEALDEVEKPALGRSVH